MDGPDYEAMEEVRKRLDSGEALVWAGRPRPARLAAMALPMFIFGMPWTAFAVLWTCGAAGFKIPKPGLNFGFLFPLWGLPFVLVGLGMLLGPVWGYLLARRMIYAATSKRLLAVFGGTVRSFTPQKPLRVSCLEREDGSGDLTFPDAVGFSPSPGLKTAPGFYGVERVREAEAALLRAFR